MTSRSKTKKETVCLLFVCNVTYQLNLTICVCVFFDHLAFLRSPFKVIHTLLLISSVCINFHHLCSYNYPFIICIAIIICCFLCMKLYSLKSISQLLFSLLKFHSTKEQHYNIKSSINPIDTCRSTYRYLSMKYYFLTIRSE